MQLVNVPRNQSCLAQKEKISDSQGSSLVSFMAYCVTVIGVMLAFTPSESNSIALSHLVRYSGLAMVCFGLLINRLPKFHYRAYFWLTVLTFYVCMLNFRVFNPDGLIHSAYLIGSFLIASLLSSGNNRWMFVRALDAVLLIWALALILQFSMSMLGFEFVDLHKVVFGYSESRTFNAFINYPRPSGLHLEPGTHAQWVFGLVMVRFFLTGIFSRSAVLAILSIPLSMSFWGLGATLFLLPVMFFNIRKSAVSGFASQLGILAGVLIVAIIVYFFASIFGDTFWEYVTVRSTLEDGSGSSKTQAYSFFFRDWFNYLLIGNNYSFDFCGGCLSKQDAGLLLNMFVYFGVLPSVLVWFVIAVRGIKSVGYVFLIFLMLVATTKFSIYEPIFWLVCFICFNKINIQRQVGDL